MPFYLNYVAASGKYMQMPATPTPFGVVASAQNFKLTINVRCVGNNPIILGSTVDDSAVTFPSATQIQLKGSSGAIALYTITSNLIDFREIEFSRTDGANVVLKINGATIDTKAFSTGLIFNRLAANNLGVSAVSFQLKFIKLEKGGALAYNWENTTGTGTQMPDTVGARPFNQIGTWPGDNSEWVSYGDPAPTGVVTLGTPTGITSSSAAIPYFYSENDETGFEYRVNGGSAITVTTSPLVVTGLTAGTFYSVEMRAVNGTTPGDWSAPATFTTEAVTTPIAFSGTIPAQTFTNGQVVSVNLAAYFTGTLTPFTFARTGAALTGTGLSISSAGVLNGTATTGGVTGVTVTGTDTASNTAVSNAFNVTVNAAVVPVSFSGTIPAITGTQNAAITPVNTSAYFTGSLTPFTYSLFSGTLPTGVTLNSSTGVISGTPTVSFSGNIVVRATDSGSNTANSNSIAVTVSAAVGTITITDIANNIDTPWISSAVDIATIMPMSLGSVVVNKTGLSTTAGADLVIADAAITTGTEYIIILKIGTAYGWYRAVAT